MNTALNRSFGLFLFLSIASANYSQQAGGEYFSVDPDSVTLSSYPDATYRRTIVPLVPSSERGAASLGPDDLLVDVEFMDGFGRLSYKVGIGRTPSKSALVSYYEADLFDRPVRSWLPVPVTVGVGDLSLEAFRSAASSFYGDSRAYTENRYESCVSDCPSGEYGPGDDWSGKYIRHTYGANSLYSRGSSCLNYQVVGNDLICSGAYSSNELYLEQCTDEDGRVVYLFTDRLGRQVLERRFDGGVSHDTYSVYDDYNELRYVLPPLASDGLTTSNVRWDYQQTAALKDYAYYYQYDDTGNCIIRRLPGCEPVYMVYDRSGRQVLSQDGNQRTENAWTVNKYDKLGRLLYVCEVTDGTPFDELVQTFREIVVTEYYSTSAHLYPAGDTGYSRNYYHLTRMRLLQVNYYDDYHFLERLPSKVSAELSFKGQTGYPTYFKNSKGLLTGTRVYLSGGASGYLTTSYYYDKQENVVQERSTNHLSGYERHFYTYTFSGKPLKHLHQHIGPTGKISPESYEYTYDHAERPLKTTYALLSTFRHLLSANTYDELCRLQRKSLNGGRENISYSYNLRGWLTDLSSTSFSEHLSYDQLGDYWGGDILSMEWRVKDENFTRRYDFRYDGLDRLTKASYTELTEFAGLDNHKFDVEIGSYDKHGNILNLTRRGLVSPALSRIVSGGGSVSPGGGIIGGSGSPGTFGLIDDLEYEYEGNRLTSVWDNSPNAPSYKDAMHFVDGTNLPGEYRYDCNGNVLCDDNKGIERIWYDRQNLPMLIRQQKVFAPGLWLPGRPRPFSREAIRYLYDCSGRKLQVGYETQRGESMPGRSSSPPVESVTIELNSQLDYCDNFIYQNDTLTTVLTPEGFFSVSGLQTRSFYYLRDHADNVRAVTDQSGKLVQVNHYYPFGGLMGGSTGGPRQPYKFGGKELDRMHGLDLYDFIARSQDPMLGRFLTMDPKCENYYSVSPYAYCMNNPLKYVDPDGKEIWISYRAGFWGLRSVSLRYENGGLFNRNGSFYSSKVKGFLSDAVNALNDLAKVKEGALLIAELQSSSNLFTIKAATYNGFEALNNMKAGANLSEYKMVTGVMNGSNGSGGTIYWNSHSVTGGFDLLGQISRPSFIGLGHELGHASDSNQGFLYFNHDYTNAVTGLQYKSIQSGLLKSEWRAVYRENLIRKQSGLPLRTHYGYNISNENPTPIGPRLLDSSDNPLNYP